jgi:pimeloyl-ACP methyl ester carboxylesterase
MSRITRHFVTVGTRRVHYRRAGEGPPVIMLHASPSWSGGIIPTIKAFAKNFTAIALDTPGYGLSDLLDKEVPEIPDYSESLKDTLDALGIERCGIYGSHTGASIAIEFIRRYPERASITVFDGYPGYTDEYRADMTKFYMPPYEPRWDGSHLLHLWMKFREQFIFSPTFRHHKDNRSNAVPTDPVRTQAGVLPRLMTGRDYAVGYSSVFRYKGLDAPYELKSKTCFAAREDDSLVKAFDLLKDLPDCCWIETLGRDKGAADERYAEIFKEHLEPGDAPPPPDPAELPGRVQCGFVDFGIGQVFVRMTGAGEARPLVMVPHVPGASDVLEPMMLELGTTRRVIAFDPPGNGDSEDFLPNNIQAYAGALHQVLSKLSVKDYDLYGRNSGASIVAAFLVHDSSEVGRIVLDGPMALDDKSRETWRNGYASKIEPKWDGTHLVHLWHALRNEQLFSPWFVESVESIRNIEPEIDPDFLSFKLTGIMKHYGNYADIWSEAFNYPIAESLASADIPTLVCARENDIFAGFVSNLAGSDAVPLPGNPEADAKVISEFLDS